MIHVITRSTKRYYETKVEEAGKLPGLEYQLQEAEEDAAMWKEQSADYEQQRDQERERTDQLTRELREARTRLDGQQAEFDRQLDAARKPLIELYTEMLDRANHPVEGTDFRRELALAVLEKWAGSLTPDEHNSPMGVILRVITGSKKPENQGEPEAPAPSTPEGRLPKADPKLVEQVRDAALLKGPEPFPGIG